MSDRLGKLNKTTLKTNQIWICVVFQQYKSYIRFTLSLDDDYSWLLYLVGISTGSVIIFRLLPFVFFSSQFVWRCDCWGQPFSSCPCQRDLWWMHLGQTCPNNCSYDSIHLKSILFSCPVSSKLPELVHSAAYFMHVHTLQWRPVKKKKPGISPVGCVIVISRWPWAYGPSIRTSYWVVLLSGHDTIIVSLC